MDDMELFRLVKAKDRYLTLNEFEALISEGFTAQCLETDEVILTYLKGKKIPIINDEQFLNANFNPLLLKQNLYFISDTVYTVPYLLLHHLQSYALIEKSIMRLSDQNRFIFINLIHFLLSKDFAFLNNIVEYDFPYPLFKVLKEFITSDMSNIEKLNEAIDLFDTAPFNDSIVFRAFLSGKNKAIKTRENVTRKIDERKTRKNVLFLHMEGISNETLYNHAFDMPNLCKLMNDSLNLCNFYSTASSTGMALTDLLYGNDFETISFGGFEDYKLLKPHSKHLFEVFAEAGYTVSGLGYNKISSREISNQNIWSFGHGSYNFADTMEEFFKGIESIICIDKPFAAHIWNPSIQICLNDADTEKCDDFVEKTRLAYHSLDQTIKHIIDLLVKKNILEDTIIVVYGDHGDDKWTRALNSGRTHIIEPYLNLVKTPAFIYDDSIGKGQFDALVSMIDLKSTALYLARIKHEDDFPYSGINIFKEKNTCAFSRSLFLNQRTEERISEEWLVRLNSFSDVERKKKSFGIINEDYNLLVGEEGSEFFIHALDPSNHNNILDFFGFDDLGKITKFKHYGAWRGHFRSVFFNDGQLFNIIKNYYCLKATLRERIFIKQTMIENDEKNLFDFALFDKIRERKYCWN